MDNPNVSPGEGIAPPRTGEFDLSQLLQYPNGRVRALARHLDEVLGWTPRDSFTGEYVSHLYNYVEPAANGGFDCSRIQPGAGHYGPAQNFIAFSRFRDGVGPDPLRTIHVESRSEFRERVGENAGRIDGSFLVGFERIRPGGGRTCINSATRDRRGRWHVTPATCHTW